MTDSVYISFWADRHHKVRIIRTNLQPGELTHGSELDWHLARYCEHLETLFKGSTIVCDTQLDHEPTSETVVEKDTAEYLEWCEQAQEEHCVV